MSERFRRGIHVLEWTKNTAVLSKWESANIDFICLANKGDNHRHRKSRPGVPRDSPRFVFQFARAAADHFLSKNLRNLRSRTMVATVACRYFPSAKCKVQCLPNNQNLVFHLFFLIYLYYQVNKSRTASENFLLQQLIVLHLLLWKKLIQQTFQMVSHTKKNFSVWTVSQKLITNHSNEKCFAPNSHK